MIWIITSPERIHEEEKIIADLLLAGVSRILLRKPEWTTQQYIALLHKINATCYDRLLIRDQPHLAAEYGLAGVHWSGRANHFSAPEQEENSKGNYTKDDMDKLFTSGRFTENSKGIHAIENITITDKRFTTLLLSPVFDSISKPGYHGRFGGPLVNKDKRNVFALGGVSDTNIGLLKQWKFDGAALMGAIWKTPAKAVDNYYRIQELWNKTDLT